MSSLSFAPESALDEQQSHERDISAGAAKLSAKHSVSGRVSDERKERLPCFHTTFLKPGTLVTECFDWSVYDLMARICHHHLETCSVCQRLPSIELLTATGGNISSL